MTIASAVRISSKTDSMIPGFNRTPASAGYRERVFNRKRYLVVQSRVKSLAYLRAAKFERTN